MPDDRRPWEVMQALLARSDVPALERYLQRLPSSETVRAVFQLRPEEQSRRSGLSGFLCARHIMTGGSRYAEEAQAERSGSGSCWRDDPA
jgi:hypothetical protein